jgi:hypothetical protein
MEAKTFNSTQISIGWYSQESKTLTVQFSNGKKYEYFDVSPEKWAALKVAESAGKYFNANIKTQHKYQPVQ